MKSWQLKIIINAPIDDFCQLAEDLNSERERGIYRVVRGEAGDAVVGLMPDGFYPHPAPVAGEVLARSTNGRTVLKVNRDGYGQWDKLYNAMQRDGWLDEQPAETSQADEPNISGGVNVNANNVTVGNDVVGRDKIIQYIKHATIIQPPPHET